MPSTAEPRPLEGLLVVSLEQAVAAPFATRQLADLGARVIKIERPGTGDFARGYDDTVNGMASYFVWLNRSKESLTLDLKSAAGRADPARSCSAEPTCSCTTWARRRRPARVRRRRAGRAVPALICCAVSGYGTDGPWADRKAYDLLVQSEAGLVSITGTRKTGKGRHLGGRHRRGHVRLQRHPDRPAPAGHDREGATVEVALFDALAEWMGQPAYYAALRREAAAAGRRPARHDRAVRAVRHRRRHRAVLRAERAGVGAVLRDVLGRPTGDDPRFATS